jgi:GDPmannose 4,6-dehydratase
MKMPYDRTAIITGISGQDGAYLAQLLLRKNYRVIGIVRSTTNQDLKGLQYLGIDSQVLIEECDLMDISRIIKLFRLYSPQEVYNLAAQSSVSMSFRQPIGTFQFNTISVYNLLEAIKMIDPAIKFYQASSSEMFGRVKDLPITEKTVLHPLSPYAISKAAAHWTCIHYRESYGIFVSCGILFNHESYLRSDGFFVKKVIKEALKIQRGEVEILSVGNIDIKRDFGYAPKYVECMHLMLQCETPQDFTICSGESVSLRSVVDHVFKRLRIDPNKCVVSEALYRPAEILDIYGTAAKAHDVLGWNYDLNFFQVLDLLIEEEANN